MSSPLSGFTAIPNPQMLAFMGAQSFIMMMQAGEGWQYGKRRQSAMTNEEFNKQTTLSIMQRQMSELKQAIPSIQQSMNNMTPMIATIVAQYGDFVSEAVKATPTFLQNIQGGQTLQGNISTVSKELTDIIKLIITPKTTTGDITGAGTGGTLSFLLPYLQELKKLQDTPTDTTKQEKTIYEQLSKLIDKPTTENITVVQSQPTKAEAIQKHISTVQVVDNSPTNPNGVKTVIFTYYPAIKDPKPPHRAIAGDYLKKQVYRFDYNGHNRKYKSIVVLAKSSYASQVVSRASAKRLLVAYTQALAKAYPNKSFG